jgi:hypothetical protein
MAGAITSIVKGGTRKSVRHYAPSLAGPERLTALEDLIDAYARDVKWEQ